MLRRLPATDDPNLLVGTATADDAGVYKVRPDLALVQTVDFFTPIVDDAFAYGQIAAANSLSDCYAMGGRPITAMNVMGVPADVLPPETIARILKGGATKVKEAGCAIVGGHTIKNPEPVYGLSVTGIATTGIKRGLASPQLEKKVVALMSRLNSPGADVAEKGLVKAATDVTGFGLLGHLASMCRASGVSAEIDGASVPAINEEVGRLIAQDCVPGGSRANLKTAEATVDWGTTDTALRTLLADAQTSGGLLLCVPPKNLDAVRQILKRHRTPVAQVIGRITRRGRSLIRLA